jgi:hypothetical protein
MSLRTVFLAVALLAACTPAGAGEPWDPRTGTPGLMYFIRIPLDAASPQEREPVLGLAMRGARERELLVLDNRMLNFIDGGTSTKLVIAGAVAVLAAMAVSGGGSGSSSGAAAPAPKPASSTSSGTSSPAPCPRVCPGK